MITNIVSQFSNELNSIERVPDNCLNMFFNTANTCFDYKSFLCINDDLFPVLLVNYGNFNGRRLVLYNNGCILKISGNNQNNFIHETFEKNYSDELSYNNKKRLDFIKSNGKGVITLDTIKLIYRMFGLHDASCINPCDYCEKIVNICNSKTIYMDYVEEIKRNIYKETGRFCTNPKQTKIVQNGTNLGYINVHANPTCGMITNNFSRNFLYIDGKFYYSTVAIENERDLIMFEKLINETLSIQTEKRDNLERHKIDIEKERDEFEEYKKLEKEKFNIERDEFEEYKKLEKEQFNIERDEFEEYKKLEKEKFNNERELIEKLINETLSMRIEKQNNLERHKIDIEKERDEFEEYKKLEKEQFEKLIQLNENNLSFKFFITFLLVIILTKLFQV